MTRRLDLEIPRKAFSVGLLKGLRVPLRVSKGLRVPLRVSKGFKSSFKGF